MKFSRRNNFAFLLALIIAPIAMAMPTQPKLNGKNVNINIPTSINTTLIHTNFTLVIETPKKPSLPVNVTLPLPLTNSTKTVLPPVQTEKARVIEKKEGTVSSVSNLNWIKQWFAWWRINIEIERQKSLRYKWRFRGRPPL
ncbi:hypothetical protein BZA77DRAFT_315151 [Pyronema omphalodes]|nr:hypothetical protein BZA77DRAFT_315151 [Pyronema omphalodes]